MYRVKKNEDCRQITANRLQTRLWWVKRSEERECEQWGHIQIEKSEDGNKLPPRAKGERNLCGVQKIRGAWVKWQSRRWQRRCKGEKAASRSSSMVPCWMSLRETLVRWLKRAEQYTLVVQVTDNRRNPMSWRPNVQTLGQVDGAGDKIAWCQDRCENSRTDACTILVMSLRGVWSCAKKGKDKRKDKWQTYIPLWWTKTQHWKTLRAAGWREKCPNGRFEIGDLDTKRKDGKAPSARREDRFRSKRDTGKSTAPMSTAETDTPAGKRAEGG